MKSLKACALVASALVALVAVAGVSTASATVLCKKTENPCSEADKWQPGIFADGSLVAGTTGTFKTAGGTTIGTCSEATISGIVEGNAGSATETPVAKGSKENVRWGNCTTRMETLTGGHVEVHHIAGTDNGTVTAREFETTINFLGVTCIFTYGTGTDVGTLTGGTAPTLDVSETLKGTSGGVCPSSAIAQGTLVLTEPKEPVYVVDS